MPAQLDIFAVSARREREGKVELPVRFVHGSETSRKAGVAIRSKSATLRERVFSVIERQGEFGCTDNEGIERSGIGGSTWRPRRVELLEAGRIRDTGMKRSGSTVWAAVAAGRDDHGI